MSDEVTYDAASQVEVIKGHPRDEAAEASVMPADGLGCHSGSEMKKAAELSGNSELLAQFAKDYPQGPHDKPQSMCPAFGSLRVGLRMRRVATVLSGSACCVYGLTFVSHFYGARRSVGYVPFNSETLVTGKLFEDIRDSVHELADPDLYDAIVVTNLCVPTASGVPLRLLPDEINGVRIVGIDVPGFGIPTHAEAKDVLAGAMLNYARKEIEAGPVAAPLGGKSDRPTVSLLGEMFPADPVMIGAMLAPMGLAAGPVVPTREWRELYSALDCGAVAAIHPFYTAAIREFEAAGRPILGSAPVGYDGTAAWMAGIGDIFGLAADQVAAAQNAFLPAIKGALAAKPITGRITLSGYEGSELLVARLLIESGAEIPYVGTACPKTPWSAEDAAWLEAKGVQVKFRASLEDDCAAMEAFQPNLAIGTTPVVQKAKELAIPGLYFTNLISARPLMGPAGAGSLAEVVNAAIAGKERMDKMRDFFEGVGEGDTAGVWEGAPNLRPDFRAAHQKKLDKMARAAKAQEMI
ncbi:chlorophyllide a reductase subunit Y [Paracoccaceae bacterium]|jgi:chlorophyllide a reductase subunit Y|nr:chlorophyllide a reductase subunit Y [Marinovum sp.]MBT3649557.1 chlorophyllide a reductase subunit Y [Paracoccaceae bacterium]OAH08039.1 light-independent protochlorophyllide reductase subunit N [Rhodobacteraceae bacterium SB2]WQC64043.1 chlorophyllide a reductase subunit Y [Alphaproteobacteria bacterium US3C007]MBT4230584.1 chlorophyllide a reductase subunit Y [Paracoccaceae bacterium]|tara:strand:- start:38184 stop:39752 length:1569 start_codon:yes stop_codon:yes gene_type:complete